MKSITLRLACALAALTASCSAFADEATLGSHPDVKHVFLISVDGLHALDMSNYVTAHPDSNLASLSRHGVTYTNDSTSSPSDSFPGLAALVTGGSPALQRGRDRHGP